jgi:Ca2+-binding RTX toxin-like protein
VADFTLTEQADYWNTGFVGGGVQTTTVFALDGADYILFGNVSGAMTVFAGDGNDTLLGSYAYDSSVGNAIYRVYGENGDDYIRGDAYNFQAPLFGTVNYLDGGAGSDTIISLSYNDTIRGGDGDDWIRIDRDGIAWGDAGNDTILAGRAFQQLILPISARGNEGNDFLSGGYNNDTLSGDEGNDLLVGREGDDWLYTGADGGTAYGDGGNDVLVGAADADTLAGGFGNDVFYGYAGRDWLSGEAGDDILLAGDGDDVLYSGVGANWLDGGAGNDVMFTEGVSDQVFTGEGQNYVYRNATSGGVIVTTGSGIDLFVGGDGASNDTVLGSAGNDYLYGGGGNDLLQGGADNDVILGQAGNDTLDGGSGVNLLWANDAGSDQILVNVADSGTQVVEFFEAGGTNDVVRLLGSNLTSFAGIQSLINNLGITQSGNLMVNAGSGAQLYLNVGANQTAIWFQGVSAYALTSGDFLFG